MANDTTLSSTVSSVLEDAVTSNDSSLSVLYDDSTSSLWRYGWPPLCMMGLVGNTLVLLVLRRDGIVRTSANVYLSALAVGDSLVLMVVSVAVYPRWSWGWWLDRTSSLSCHVVWPVSHTLALWSVWLIVAFTVERCVVVRFPLLKLRLCIPRIAGLCCVSLLVLAFLKNINLFFITELTINGRGNVVCKIKLLSQDYYQLKIWFNLAVSSIIPTCVVLVCNWAIIQTLRRKLMTTAAQDSVRRTTYMCLGVSFAFIVCVIPGNVFYVVYFILNYWPVTYPSPLNVFKSLVFLRYANHAINLFLYSLTGAHFRYELVAMFRNCLHRGRAVFRRLQSRFQFRRGLEDNNFIEMR